MNDNFRAHFRKFGPMVISISGIVLVILSLVACALSAQRTKKNSPKKEPTPLAVIEEMHVPDKVTVSVKEFEYNDTTYILIEKEGSNSFSVILK